MRRLIILLLISLFLISCDEKDCEAFDFSSSVVGWHLFPDRQSEYVFVTDSLTKTYERVYEQISEKETITCGGGCECNTRFHSTYFGHSTRFQSTVLYDIDREDYPQPIIFSVNSEDVLFNVDASANLIGNSSDGIPLNSHIDYDISDTITIDNNMFENVLHVTFIEESNVSELWIAYGFGLIAFKQNDELHWRN